MTVENITALRDMFDPETIDFSQHSPISINVGY